MDCLKTECDVKCLGAVASTHFPLWFCSRLDFSGRLACSNVFVLWEMQNFSSQKMMLYRWCSKASWCIFFDAGTVSHIASVAPFHPMFWGSVELLELESPDYGNQYIPWFFLRFTANGHTQSGYNRNSIPHVSFQVQVGDILAAADSIYLYSLFCTLYLLQVTIFMLAPTYVMVVKKLGQMHCRYGILSHQTKITNIRDLLNATHESHIALETIVVQCSTMRHRAQTLMCIQLNLFFILL